MLSERQEELLIRLLAHVYNRILWGKMRTSKNPHDIFNSRVKAATRKGTMFGFINSLCEYFGLQTTSFDTMEIVIELRRDESTVLNVLSREHIPFCVLGIQKSKELKIINKSTQGEK